MTEKLTLELRCPPSEVSEQFLQGMIDRMGTSYYRYGRAADAYPHHVDAIDSLLERLRKYRQDANLEWLIDVGNFAMLEFMFPSLEDAHFSPTDSDQSPGRKVTHGDRKATNSELRER